MTNASNERSLTDHAKNPRVWLGVAIAVVAFAFIAQNRDPVVSNLFMLPVHRAGVADAHPGVPPRHGHRVARQAPPLTSATARSGGL